MKFKVFTDNKDAEKEVYFKLTQDRVVLSFLPPIRLEKKFLMATY